MAINTTCLSTNLQSQIDGFTCATTPEDMLSAASSARNLTSDIESYVSLGCELPDLSLGTTPPGTMFYVDELGVPVVAGSQSWLGLDGRTYRKDKPDTAIYGWGTSLGGGLGDGSAACCRSSPTQEVSSSSNWCFISAGGCRSSAINYKGELYVWGSSFTGDGTNITRSSPVQEICSSTMWCFSHNSPSDHRLAIKNDNTLWAWGANTYGQLGVNSTLVSCSPIQEASCSYNWCVTSGGFSFSAAVKTDGTLWTWGRNNLAQLGIGISAGSDYSSPIQEFCCATNWCFVESGNDNNAALKTDGTLWGWGSNAGDLGIGCTTNVCSPVQEICSATNWLRVSAGYRHHVAIKTDGTLWSMGSGACGNLGTNSSASSNTAVQEITSSTNWTQACAAVRYTVALKSTGEIFSFGCNLQGQLGIGAQGLCYSSPIQEYTSATNWSAVSAALCHTLALKTIV